MSRFQSLRRKACRRNLSLRNAALICNPFAGWRNARRSHQLRDAIAVLRNAGIAATIKYTSNPGDGEELARAAVDSGCDLVIACGGDGTINEVINGMAPSRTPLAILPGGTANIVARELRLPGSIARAAKQLPSWSPCRIPLGRASWNDSGSPRRRYFIAVAGIGFDAHIISQLNVPLKLRMGVAAYVYEALRQTFRYGFPGFECAVNGQKVSGTFAVVQRSRRYAGWLRLARSHSIRDLKFSCAHFKSDRPRRYFLYALAVLTQTHHRLPDVAFLRGSHVCCTGSKPDEAIYFEVDGELAGRLPVSFETVPDALTLMAPQSFTTSP
ncbi:MAG: diacylglycerol kinase family protein [Acidobacteriota bacterium]